MTKRNLKAAAAAALLFPIIAFAEVIVVNGEAGMVFKDEPSTITREQVRAELEAGKALPEEHFKWVGGEAGRSHVNPSHRMVVQNGNLVHAADCPVLASLTALKTRPLGSDDFLYHGA